MAATSGQLETVEALLDRGCDANVQDFVSFVADYTITITITITVTITIILT